MRNLILLFFAFFVTSAFSFPFDESRQPVFFVKDIDTLSHNQSQSVDIEANVGLYGTVKPLNTILFGIRPSAFEEKKGRENLYLSFKGYEDYLVIIYPESYLNLKEFYSKYGKDIQPTKNYATPQEGIDVIEEAKISVFSINHDKILWSGSISSGAILISYFSLETIGIRLYMSYVELNPKLKLNNITF